MAVSKSPDGQVEPISRVIVHRSPFVNALRGVVGGLFLFGAVACSNPGNVQAYTVTNAQATSVAQRAVDRLGTSGAADATSTLEPPKPATAELPAVQTDVPVKDGTVTPPVAEEAGVGASDPVTDTVPGGISGTGAEGSGQEAEVTAAQIEEMRAVLTADALEYPGGEREYDFDPEKLLEFLASNGVSQIIVGEIPVLDLEQLEIVGLAGSERGAEPLGSFVDAANGQCIIVVSDPSWDNFQGAVFAGYVRRYLPDGYAGRLLLNVYPPTGEISFFDEGGNEQVITQTTISDFNAMLLSDLVVGADGGLASQQ